MGKLDFLNQYESVNTVKAYNAALKNFFEMVYDEREPLETLAERYFQEKRDYEADIQNFLVHLKGLAPKSVRLKITAVRVFFLKVEVSKLRVEVEERNRQLHVLVNGLTAENLEMKSKVAKVELENTNLRRDVAELQQGIAKVTSMVERLIEAD